MVGQFVTVIVKPTLDCNIDCRHCYHLSCDRSDKIMDISTFEKTVKLVKDGFDSSRFIWHGGEPLLAPVSFYKSVFSVQKRYYSQGCDNTIQTNGTLLNKRLIEFCRSNRVNIGISYEGGFERGLRPGMDTKKIDKLVDFMVNKGHMFMISATIHGGNVNDMSAIYEKFKEMGASFSFNPVIMSGTACDNPDLELDPDVYVQNAIEVFDEWISDPSVKISVLPFYPYVMTALDGVPNISDCPHSSCLMKWICVHPNGDVYPCGKACPPEFRLGNVNEVSSIDELFDSDGMRNILVPSIQRRNECSDCDIYRYCNGGCTIDALADGKIDSPGGSACRIYKGLFTHIKDTVEDIMAKKPDMNAYNGFIKDAILNRLINPQ